MKDYAKIFPPGSGTLLESSESFSQNKTSSVPRQIETAFIFVVDEERSLTDLYTHFLKRTGYVVQAFNHRAEAMAALEAAGTKPDLLITDYLGRSMPIERFIQGCRVIHPGLRILMASGLSEKDERLSRIKADRFLQKPFTLDKLQQEVSAALTDS